jgi:hypothetical protein
MPNQSSKAPPIGLRRPKANNSATPPTTGGKTIGKTQSARRNKRPLNRRLANSHASGVPKISARTVAIIEVRKESKSATRDDSLEIEVQKFA